MGPSAGLYGKGVTVRHLAQLGSAVLLSNSTEGSPIQPINETATVMSLSSSEPSSNI